MPENKGYFFEEYAVTNAKVKHILNGHILSMMHLKVYIDNYKRKFTPDLFIKKLEQSFNSAIDVVFHYMSRFDAKTKRYGYTTYYDLNRVSVKSAEKYPHRIHVCGLYWLFNLTKREGFYLTAKKWHSYRKKPIYCRKQLNDAKQLYDSMDN